MTYDPSACAGRYYTADADAGSEPGDLSSPEQSPTPPSSDQQLYHHQRTRLPPESAAESPVSDRGTPASRTDTQRERKMWRRQMEDAGGAERLQVETANPWLPCAQQARGDLPGRRHALASNLRHTKGQRWPRPP